MVVFLFSLISPIFTGGGFTTMGRSPNEMLNGVANELETMRRCFYKMSTN